MPKHIIKLFSIICLSLGLCLIAGNTCHAEVLFQNEETGYVVDIEDDAGLLSQSELADLALTMEAITTYGNAAFKTITENPSSAASFARSYYSEKFGSESGTLFLIDMDTRYIQIHSDGAVYKVITKDRAETITDNVYGYASDQAYFYCANLAFTQIQSLLEGNRITQPMKYLSNGVLALFLALLINFAWVSHFSRIKKPKPEDIIANIHSQFHYSNPTAVLDHETKTYSPVSSSSSSGSRSGGGSRSRSGGGRSRSGGGGGHRF